MTNVDVKFRKFERFTRGAWEEVPFEKLLVGDLFRAVDKPEEQWVALSEPVDDWSVVGNAKIDCVPAPAHMKRQAA